MIQDVVLENILKNDVLVGQGFLARCLIVSPASNAGHRPYNPVDISKDPIIRQFEAWASNFLDQALPLANSETPNELAPRPLGIEVDGKARWIQFHDETDRALKPDGYLYPIRRTANKGAEQVLRIAGVLTLVEDFKATNISLENIERAIELMQFYFDEGLRITDMSACDPNLELAQAVLMWMKKKTNIEGPQKTFSLQEIYQKAGPRNVRNKKTAQKVMGILEEHNQIQRLNQEKLEWRLK